MNNLKFRHEIKHFINISDIYILRSRLKSVMNSDPNAGDDGKYKIRSLYFDNINNKALMEKINGYNKREKIRIRFYNNDPSYIKLEKKIKNNGLCAKQSALITQKECNNLLAGNTEWMLKSNKNILIELYTKMKYQLLKPKTVVDYFREAYIYKPGNIRVTIDTNVRTGIFSKDIFNPKLPTVSVLPPGIAILEVKFDEFLPDIINDVIQMNNRKSTTISKYVACRIYG